MQQKAQDKFHKAFCLSWKEALDQGLVYNLVDSPAVLGRPMSELGAEHDKLDKCETMLSPLQKDRGHSLSKASTRAYVSSTEPGTAIYYHSSSGTRIAQLGGLPRKGLRRHRPEDHLSHVPSKRHIHGLEGVGTRCRTQRWEQLGARLR